MMKIFNNKMNNNSKTIGLKRGGAGKTKYLPSYGKQWKNIIYSYNKNYIKNIPANDVNINKIIKSYFNLYFKYYKYIGSKKFILLKRRRRFLRTIYVSNAEIKHRNDKARVTLYTVNREKTILKEKYLIINKKVGKNLINRYLLLYKKTCKMLNNKRGIDKYEIISKKNYLSYKLKCLKRLLELRDIGLKKIWNLLIKKYQKSYLILLRKYDFLYSLNQYKFNKKKFLPVLSKILDKIINKKIEYNIINHKSIAYNTDLFTNALALKLKKKKTSYIKNMLSILNRANILRINPVSPQQDYKNQDLKIISKLTKNKIIERQRTKQIHKTIYNSIRYKNMGGIRIEVKGRLTKRYRADRSVHGLKWKGGLKNRDSSFKGLSSVLVRGNTNSNVSYSLFKSKRRIGAFAVKGWISGK